VAGREEQERTVTLRERINKYPTQSAAVAAGGIVLALLFIMWQACGGSGGGPGKSYYSVDDGATFFVDDSNKIPPFKHEGKDAVRAHVFRCGSGEPFVGYLEMYDPQTKKMMEDAIAGKAPPMAYGGYTGQAMVKKPKTGPMGWVPLSPATTEFYAKTVQVTCPDGKTPERVYPD
jgi:hypothetical protein